MSSLCSSFWKRDDELAAGVALLFDRALLDIYCTEDVAVLLMAAAETDGKARIVNVKH